VYVCEYVCVCMCVSDEIFSAFLHLASKRNAWITFFGLTKNFDIYRRVKNLQSDEKDKKTFLIK